MLVCITWHPIATTLCPGVNRWSFDRVHHPDWPGMSKIHDAVSCCPLCHPRRSKCLPPPQSEFWHNVTNAGIQADRQGYATSEILASVTTISREDADCDLLRGELVRGDDN